MDPAGTAAGGCQGTASLAGEDKLSLEKEARGTFMAATVNVLVSQKVTVFRLINLVSINSTLCSLSGQR